MGEVVLASSGMVIKAGGVFELPIKVDRPSVLRIRFEVDEGYDVDFSLKFLEDTDKASIQTVRAGARARRVPARQGARDLARAARNGRVGMRPLWLCMRPSTTARRSCPSAGRSRARVAGARARAATAPRSSSSRRARSHAKGNWTSIQRARASSSGITPSRGSTPSRLRAARAPPAARLFFAFARAPARRARPAAQRPFCRAWFATTSMSPQHRARSRRHALLPLAAWRAVPATRV